ncbi:PREDICTED: uncharacterized protein LOC105449131 [Wasmannia auropunctata]|uniref:uncharacterized protein LOC105449131 n=1 Tax=Wasmannia auropunctata TaxID=64793 RepID=UPI0005EFD19C|nr:PREDICTED: uncharacterized protein LOC105449131 [Wasmannia auropunctata]
MSFDVESMLTAQKDIHGRISRSVINLKKMDKITPTAVETRLTLLDQYWAKFETQHELIRDFYNEDFEKSEYNESQLFDTAENTYVLQRSELREYAKSFAATTPNPSLPREPGHEVTSKTSLPRLKIRSFSGKFEDWPSFRDIFLSIVGDNPKGPLKS